MGSAHGAENARSSRLLGEEFDEADAHHLRPLPRGLDRLFGLTSVGSVRHGLE